MDPSKSNVINDEIYNERRKRQPSNNKKGANMIHIEDFHDGHHDHAYIMDEDNLDEDQDGNDEEYSDKKQLVAFLLCVMLGQVGAGRWYAGSYGLASFKMILFLSIMIGLCLLIFCIIPNILAMDRTSNGGSVNGLICCNGAYGGIATCFVLLCYFGFIAFQITDIVLFVNNDITDEDGLTLKPW